MKKTKSKKERKKATEWRQISLGRGILWPYSVSGALSLTPHIVAIISPCGLATVFSLPGPLYAGVTHYSNLYMLYSTVFAAGFSNVCCMVGRLTMIRVVVIKVIMLLLSLL